ncbi:CDP-alcohol phosphatidyltransferase [Xanthomonas bromi]|uniref:CDP-alcohol phosphatidyltransferase n=1 Tax=Xanthomonas bromi TaxID=56449 RepID=A0A1C3NLL4_9XANT|nr:CDP-alcohol phosphatidyltransferase [Xanthomonas bromi]
MGWIHAVKGRGQALLRPMVGALYRGGIAANRVMLIAAAVVMAVVDVAVMAVEAIDATQSTGMASDARPLGTRVA